MIIIYVYFLIWRKINMKIKDTIIKIVTILCLFIVIKTLLFAYYCKMYTLFEPEDTIYVISLLYLASVLIIWLSKNS